MANSDFGKYVYYVRCYVIYDAGIPFIGRNGRISSHISGICTHKRPCRKPFSIFVRCENKFQIVFIETLGNQLNIL